MDAKCIFEHEIHRRNKIFSFFSCLPCSDKKYLCVSAPLCVDYYVKVKI